MISAKTTQALATTIAAHIEESIATKKRALESELDVLGRIAEVVVNLRLAGKGETPHSSLRC